MQSPEDQNKQSNSHKNTADIIADKPYKLSLLTCLIVFIFEIKVRVFTNFCRFG